MYSKQTDKPLGKKNYGSIPHLPGSRMDQTDHYITPGQASILTQKTRDRHDFIIVTEKYDGSNVGIAKVRAQIVPLTRAGYRAETSPYEQHHWFAKYVMKNQHFYSQILKEGERLVGEWLAMTHSISYEITGDPIVFFDHFDANNKRKRFIELAQMGVPTPPVLYAGGAVPVSHFAKLFDSKQHRLRSQQDQRIRSLQPPEGIVYRCERKQKFDFCAKWVRPDFVPGSRMTEGIRNRIL